ncbi:hypothetical protein [Saccharopolyspora sp. NPDC002578]
MNIRRSAAFLAVTATVAATAVVGTGAAVAAEDDWCGPDDLRVTVDQVSPEEFALDFTAADPATDCVLQGYPHAMSFHFISDQLPVDIDNPGEHSPEVRITADSPGRARITQDPNAEPTAQVPTAALFALPTADSIDPQYVAAQWPERAELKSTITVWPLLPA